MQEEDHIKQEPISQQINIEENSGSDDGNSPTPPPSTPPSSEPPPMTNDLGEPVVINTTTIRVGTDYFKPTSEVEVDQLIDQQRINTQQKEIFQVGYEANYGSLPKETVQKEDSTETDSTETITVDKEVEEQVIPSSILPQTDETEKETEGEDKTINLKELAGEDYQPTVSGNVDEGNVKDMPVPTEIAAPSNDAPLIDLAQLSSNEDSTGSEESAPVVKAPSPTPETDSDFQAVTEKIAKQGEKTQKHESSRRATEKAKKASVEPQNKKQSLAEAKQVDVMESKETPAFDTSSFVNMLMAKIKAITPKSEEEADKFKDNNKVHEVKATASGQIEQKKTASVGPLETATKQTPDQSGIPSKEVTPLGKAPIGRKPKDLGIEQGMPKKKKTEEVEQPIQQNSQELEQQFSDNEITDEQLAKSNEPTFMSALETKTTAQEDSTNAPQQLRTEEDQTLQATQSGAKQDGKDDLLAMHQDRAKILTNVQGKQNTASGSYTTEEAKVATKINSIYQSTQKEVEGTLSRLDSRVSQLFDQGAAIAQKRFENYIANEMAIYKEERYDGMSGLVVWAYDSMAGLPDEVNKFFVAGRKEYIKNMEQTIQTIADLVAQELTAAKQRVQAGRQEVADYVESLPDNLQKVGKATADSINRKFDELNAKVDAKQGELIDSLAQKYVESVAAVDSRIEEMKAANRGLIDMALDSIGGVIATILEVKNALMGILSAAMDAITAIISDPIGFLSNLIEGVGNGISNFMAKIDEYLTTGFVEWLTGAMSGTGIEMPENIFSLEGIFSITTQALGMTWDFIRERAVGVLGERAVGTIEESFEIFQIIREEGMGGAWEYLKEQFGDLQETIMGTITEMLVSEVVEAGIKYLLAMLTPAGAFVKAAMMIVDVAKFFIEKGSQIMELVDAFVQSVSAIAAGSVGKVAEMIERALALSVPLLIGMFTSLLGLGDLAAKVTKIFKNIKGRVTGAVDGFIEKAGTWFKDKKGRRKERKEKKDKEKGEKKKGKTDSDKDKKKDKKEDKDDKEDKDKRTDKQQKIAFDTGMQKGAAVVNNENLSNQAIKIELNQLELKYKLKKLDAKLISEKEDMQTWMLSGKLEEYKGTKTIERKPTKAESEEEVSEADRKLHQRIAAEVKAQLEAKGKSTEGVETFEEFYGLLQSEAVMLQKKYQPQLRDGIKIAVDLVNSVKQDEKDGDVDVRIRIAPNATEKNISLFFDSEEEGMSHYKVKIRKIISSMYTTSARVTLEQVKSKIEKDIPELNCTSNYEDEANDQGFISIAIKTNPTQVIGKIVQKRHKPIQKPEDTDRDLEKIEEDRKKEEANAREVYEGEDLKLYLRENNKDAHKAKEGAKKRAVDRTVYKDLLTDEEVVKDNWEQFMPRQQKRYLNDHDVSSLENGNGIKASGNTSSLLENVLGDRTGGGRLSVTKETKHQITGGYTGKKTNTNSPQPTFNNNGAVDVDMAKIPLKNETFDVSTEHGRQQLINERQGNKKLKGNDMIRGLTDVIRTGEVLVKGEIPDRAISNYQTKDEIDNTLTTKKVEKPNEKGQTLKERTPKQGFSEEKAKEELSKVELEVISLSNQDKNK